MCWFSEDWAAYRAWKAEIDAELVKLTGKHLVDVLLPNDQGERDQYSIGGRKVKSLFADFSLGDYDDKTDKFTYDMTPAKQMAEKLIKALNIPLKATKKKAATPVIKRAMTDLEKDLQAAMSGIRLRNRDTVTR